MSRAAHALCRLLTHLLTRLSFQSERLAVQQLQPAALSCSLGPKVDATLAGLVTDLGLVSADALGGPVWGDNMHNPITGALTCRWVCEHSRVRMYVHVCVWACIRVRTLFFKGKDKDCASYHLHGSTCAAQLHWHSVRQWPCTRQRRRCYWYVDVCTVCAQFTLCMLYACVRV